MSFSSISELYYLCFCVTSDPDKIHKNVFLILLLLLFSHHHSWMQKVLLSISPSLTTVQTSKCNLPHITQQTCKPKCHLFLLWHCLFHISLRYSLSTYLVFLYPSSIICLLYLSILHQSSQSCIYFYFTHIRNESSLDCTDYSLGRCSCFILPSCLSFSVCACVYVWEVLIAEKRLVPEDFEESHQLQWLLLKLLLELINPANVTHNADSVALFFCLLFDISVYNWFFKLLLLLLLAVSMNIKSTVQHCFTDCCAVSNYSALFSISFYVTDLFQIEFNNLLPQSYTHRHLIMTMWKKGFEIFAN